MTIDNKVSFISGFMLTAATSVSIVGVVQAAIVGLVGGFFGLIGKEVFYYIKRQIKR
jgi:hypothetical protein